MRTFIRRLLMMLALLAGAGHAAEVPPIEAFAKRAAFTALKLSPDGRHVAALAPNERNSSVLTIRIDGFKPVGQLKLDPDDHILDFWWGSDTRIVAALGYQEGPREAPIPTGELVAVDVDGRNFTYLYGYRHETGSSGGGQSGSASMIDPLIDDPDHILIALHGWRRGGIRYAGAYRCNIRTGERTLLAYSPVLDVPTDFIVDAEGSIRYAVTRSGAFSRQTWQRSKGKDEWQPVKVPGSAALFPIGFSKNGQSVFVVSHEFGPRSCLVQHVIETNERRKLACDDHSDLSAVIHSFEPHAEPIAAVFAAGKPEFRMLDSGHPHRELLKLLMEAFPGKGLEVASITRDGRLALIHTYDDRSPGDYYLFDTQTRKADYFQGARDWIDPDQMSERRPINLKARDGTSLWGYLTLPVGRDPGKLPLVVNPHGGPFYIRDEWAFDTDAQLLASRGYAVLQINFRGSGGYGNDFLAAGKKAWATTMIDDISDAVQWTIGQGYADAKRVCIYGSSYGAYAAMISAERAPELYRCVVGYSGAYDLKLLKRTSDSTRNRAGREYFKEAIAGTDAELVAQSPITHLDQLKAPVLIVHGEIDDRTPLSQAKTLRKALDQRQHPYRWLTRADEGHGFWRTENILAFYGTMLEFLDEHIGSASVAAAEPAAP